MLSRLCVTLSSFVRVDMGRFRHSKEVWKERRDTFVVLSPPEPKGVIHEDRERVFGVRHRSATGCRPSRPRVSGTRVYRLLCLYKFGFTINVTPVRSSVSAGPRWDDRAHVLLTVRHGQCPRETSGNVDPFPGWRSVPLLLCLERLPCPSLPPTGVGLAGTSRSYKNS